MNFTRRDVSLMGVSALGGCTLGRPTFKVRYCMRIRAIIDGEPKEGSAVHEIRWVPNPTPWGPAHTGPFRNRFWAEAPFIDLGERGLLVALLGAPVGYDRAAFNIIHSGFLFQLLPRDMSNELDYENGELMEAVARLQGEIPLAGDREPVLVRIRNRHDLNSVELSEGDKFDDLFGAHSSFSGATIEITDLPLTAKIEDVLPWVRLERERTRVREEQVFGPSLASRLNWRDFKLDGWES